MYVKQRKRTLILIGCLTIAVILPILIFVVVLLNRKPASTITYTSDLNLERTFSEIVGAPVFSAESGFYDKEFMLTISAEKGEIYYTLDGTDPAFSDTAVLYEAPVKIYDNTQNVNVYSAVSDITLSGYMPPSHRVEKGMILRAAVKDENGAFGETVTKSYFVGKTKDYYQDMKVISLVTNPYNLFDSKEGIYVVGDAYYEWRKSPDFDPFMEDWREENPTNYNNSGKEWERPAVIQIFEKGQLVYDQMLGIRLSGHVSRSNAQKSIRLYAREEYGDKKIRYAFFDGLKDINGKSIEKFDKMTLRNEGNDTASAFFRDELVQSLCDDRAVGLQAEAPCILFIDGEFWGMYHIKERIEDYYFASHYDLEKANVTFVKCDETEGSEEVRQEYEDFYKWAMSADLSKEENYQKVADTIDMQSLMDYFAIETYINNYDWLYVGRTPNNILMWRVNEKVDDNPYGDGKWRFVFYDMEYSANLYGQEGTRPEYDAFKNISTQNVWYNPGALFFRLLDNQTFRTQFYSTYIEIMENNFDPDRVMAWIDEYMEEHALAITDTFYRFLAVSDRNGYFDYHVNQVRNFYCERPAYARQYLDNLIYRYSE